MLEEASGDELEVQHWYRRLENSEKELLNSLIVSQRQQGNMKPLEPVRFIMRNVQDRRASQMLATQRKNLITLSEETRVVNNPWSSLKEMAMKNDLHE